MYLCSDRNSKKLTESEDEDIIGGPVTSGVRGKRGGNIWRRCQNSSTKVTTNRLSNFLRRISVLIFNTTFRCCGDRGGPTTNTFSDHKLTKDRGENGAKDVLIPIVYNKFINFDDFSFQVIGKSWVDI